MHQPDTHPLSNYWQTNKFPMLLPTLVRPGKSVQCSSYLEFAFSNVPQKCVKTTGKFDRALRVHYPQRIIF